ncbi:MAG: hypothetical protein M1399_01725 [Actinobacteria bacterium]|nr:hypothetical protein [Actinomycetota bacterium]MCL5445799.1 hypothetical protein [Actinomycetota bacterium]
MPSTQLPDIAGHHGHTGHVAAASSLEESLLPSPVLFDKVCGQQKAVDLLRASARRPVHAYLLLGPSGLGQRELWRGFAASILCPQGGCGKCEWCMKCLQGIHPDLSETENTGLALSVDEAHDLVRMAQRTPLLASWQVLVVQDIARAYLAAPVLLKTLEEPPRRTVFVLTADSVPPSLATIRSRCLTVELALPQLYRHGAEGPATPHAPQAQSCMPMASPAEDHLWDPWISLPSRIEPVGSSIATMADDLLATVEKSVTLLASRQAEEMKEYDDHEAGTGTTNRTLRNRILERQHRELRRERTVGFRKGLLALRQAYEDELIEVARHYDRKSHTSFPSSRSYRIQTLSSAIDAIDHTAAQLIRNPNEALLLQALLLKLANV